jgi:hypothetical protein
MKKSLLEIYGLAVCFITMACFVIFFGIAAWDIVKLSKPEFTVASTIWGWHQTDETYKEHLVEQHRWGEKKAAYVPPVGPALTEAREKSFSNELRSERRDGAQDLVRSLIVMLIDLAAFALHWKIAARARQIAS